MDEKVAAIAERLAKLSPEAQAEELARIEKNVTRRETKAQKSALESHKVGIADHAVTTVQLYCSENKLSITSILPLNIKVVLAEDGKSVKGTVSGSGRSGGGGNGTRGESFLKTQGVKEIQLNGKSIKRCAEIQVLRDLYGEEKAKVLTGGASAHTVTIKPEVISDIRKAGFTAILEDGTTKPLADIYKQN